MFIVSDCAEDQFRAMNHEPLSVFIVSVCTENQFRCDNGRCIMNGFRCDGNIDCRDTSDEMNCSIETETWFRTGAGRTEPVCQGSELPCASAAMCIPRAWFCDGYLDCEDGSDEGTHCKLSRLMAKPVKWHVRPAKTQISLVFRPV